MPRASSPSRKRTAKPPRGFVFRDYGVRDFDALLRLDRECFVEGIAYTEDEMSKFLHHRGAFTIVAEDAAGHIVGFVVTLVQKRFAWIITIDVHADARRSGLGTRLMQAVEQRLAEKEVIAVLLEVAVDNLSAIKFYKRLGYDISRTLPRYYMNKLDAFEMIKSLE